MNCFELNPSSSPASSVSFRSIRGPPITLRRVASTFQYHGSPGARALPGTRVSSGMTSFSCYKSSCYVKMKLLIKQCREGKSGNGVLQQISRALDFDCGKSSFFPVLTDFRASKGSDWRRKANGRIFRAIAFRPIQSTEIYLSYVPMSMCSVLGNETCINYSSYR